jgi:hypothetical protein
VKSHLTFIDRSPFLLTVKSQRKSSRGQKKSGMVNKSHLMKPICCDCEKSRKSQIEVIKGQDKSIKKSLDIL